MVEYVPQAPHGQQIGSTPYFKLMADTHGAGFVHCGDGVLVVPVTEEGQVLMAFEWSPAFNREILVAVGGSVEADEPLEETANRELQEELGWRARRIQFLGEIHPFKYLTSRQFVFLARDLSPSKLTGDEQHQVSTREVPIDAWLDLCLRGELQDAPSITALCLARDFLSKESS